MPSSGMLHSVTLSGECIASIIWVTRIGEVGTLAVTSNRSRLRSLMMEAIRSYETSVITRVTRCHIPEDGILHSHSSENPKSYKGSLVFKSEPMCGEGVFASNCGA
jgi:hypothetical protein